MHSIESEFDLTDDKLFGLYIIKLQEEGIATDEDFTVNNAFRSTSTLILNYSVHNN